MIEQFEHMRTQLDNLLSEGFTTPEQVAAYQDLKSQYETATGDRSFSVRELTGQLEVIMSNRENAFPDLDGGVRAEYLELIERLEPLDGDQASYYRRQLEEA